MSYVSGDGRLGVVPVAAAAAAVKLAGGLIQPKSPRYGGGDGPLYSTVNSFITRIATGDLGVIEQLNQLRQTDADKVQWSLFWNTDMLRQPLTQAQAGLIVKLDPSKAGLTAQNVPVQKVSASGPAPSSTPVLQVTTPGQSYSPSPLTQSSLMPGIIGAGMLVTLAILLRGRI